MITRYFFHKGDAKFYMHGSGVLGDASPLELRAWVAHGPLLTESDAGEWPRVNDALNLVVRRRYFTLEDRDSDPRGSYQLIFSVSFSPEMYEYLYPYESRMRAGVSVRKTKIRLHFQQHHVRIHTENLLGNDIKNARPYDFVRAILIFG